MQGDIPSAFEYTVYIGIFGIVWALILLSRERARKRKALAAQPYVQPFEAPGSAEFASEATLKKAGLLGKKGILIGYTLEHNIPVKYDGDAMLFTAGPVGTRKTTSQIIPNVLSLDDRSLLIFCAKGETPAVAGHYRKGVGPVYLLNPYQILMDNFKGLMQAHYNPIDRLLDPREGRINFNPNAAKLAEGCTWREKSGSEAEFFSSSSRQGTHGLIMGVACHEPPGKKTLIRVAEIASSDEIFEFSRYIVKTTKDEFIRHKLGRFAVSKKDQDDRTLSGIIETMRTNLSFLSEEAMAETLSRSDFRFRDLREKVCTVIVTVPLDKIEIADRFFRLILSCACAEVLQPGRAKVRTLFMMDEFYQYGALPQVEAMFGIARGFGIQLWPFVQDLSQLQDRYPKTWETFLSNAAVRCYMTPQDETTATYVSRQAGFERIVTASPSVNLDQYGGYSAGWGKSIDRQEILLPHEARAIPDDMMLAFFRDVGPAMLRKIPYHKRREFRGKHRPNPFYPGAK